MNLSQDDIQKIFHISSACDFNELASKIFLYQYHHNDVYHSFVDHLPFFYDKEKLPESFPFIPIEFFKQHKVICGNTYESVFSSSGTTAAVPSRHYVKDLSVYSRSFMGAFQSFYGSVKDRHILALLPSYLEREGSSLVYMARALINASGHKSSGFYLNNMDDLAATLAELEQQGKPVLLLGVSFALLDFAERYPMPLSNTIIMETGGMKGRRAELLREEVHRRLKSAFGLESIHSEYGMTELLSQAYSSGQGRYISPPWMKVLIRDINDPMRLLPPGKSGGISIIDLANVHSCSFLATSDLGKMHDDGSFEVLGRFDNSDIRGCNLMVS